MYDWVFANSPLLPRKFEDSIKIIQTTLIKNTQNAIFCVHATQVSKLYCDDTDLTEFDKLRIETDNASG